MKRAANFVGMLLAFCVAAPLFIWFMVTHDWFQLRFLTPYLGYLVILPVVLFGVFLLAFGMGASLAEPDDGEDS